MYKIQNHSKLLWIKASVKWLNSKYGFITHDTLTEGECRITSEMSTTQEWDIKAQQLELMPCKAWSKSSRGMFHLNIDPVQRHKNQIDFFVLLLIIQLATHALGFDLWMFPIEFCLADAKLSRKRTASATSLRSEEGLVWEICKGVAKLIGHAIVKSSVWSAVGRKQDTVPEVVQLCFSH